MVVISPHENNNQNDIDKVVNFWRLLGSSSKILYYQDHDFLFSKTSHLPHVISTSTESLFKNLGDKTFDFSGGVWKITLVLHLAIHICGKILLLIIKIF